MWLWITLACTSAQKGGATPTDSAADSGSADVSDSADSAGSGCVETAGGALPDDAPWLAWDDGTPASSMWHNRRGAFTDTEGTSHSVYETPGWEAVRFEIDTPSRLLGLQVAWFQLPEAEAPVQIGLYDDYGWNGMDFHPDPPRWVGTRCLSEGDERAFVTYRIDPPLEIDGPALIYAASFRDGARGPTLSMDASGADPSCATWDACHSVINYPDVDAASYDNGTTFPWGSNDLLVRLQAEPTRVVAPEERWFTPVESGQVGARASWGDYDGDGDDDLMGSGPVLYRNDSGTFTDVSDEAGIRASGISTGGGVWGDYDNDGCLDYFGFNESRSSGPDGEELLLRSRCDGTFEDVTLAAGISDYQDRVDCLSEGPQHSPTAAAAWADLDNDGLLDLIEANFLCFDDYTSYPDLFWHNNGDGTFTALGREAGLTSPLASSRGIGVVDADLDGDLDVLINTYVLEPDLYYENLGGGFFAERAQALGLAGTETTERVNHYFGHTIGTAWGDLDGDGDWDAVAANLAHPRFYSFSDKTNVLLQDAPGVWTDASERAGLDYHETHSNPSLIDLDNDGDLDLTLTEVYDGRPTDVYLNDGAARFTPARLYAGLTTTNGWGSAVADFDNDGDQDWVGYTVFANQHATGHWLQLRLIGDVYANRAAIGAIAWVTTDDGVTRMRSVSGGNGTGCQDSQTLHFGLGDATRITGVEVWFPGGEWVRYDSDLLGVDAAWQLTESGVVRPGLAD